jgi:CheY-like chemotaxis protein
MRSQRILALDAQMSILIVVKDFFQGLGFKVDTCSDLASALENVEINQYDLVLIDPMDKVFRQAEGLDLIQYIHQKSIDTKVIILTAYIKPEIGRILSRFGISAVVKKPVPLSDLAQIVFAVLGK